MTVKQITFKSFGVDAKEWWAIYISQMNVLNMVKNHKK